MKNANPLSFHLNGRCFVEGQGALADEPEAFGFFRRTPGGHLLLFQRNGRRIGGIRCDGLLYRSGLIEIEGKNQWWHQPASPEELGGIHDYDYGRMREEVGSALEIAYSLNG
ncbi:hypothetical protein [Thioalkalivibrio sp. ALE19]|uniref:hypothetical protein n=1 Tax=Thioalkalivibrio sp. ALE19 TaxID=1266909 RepID=UPI00040EC6CA|nr:hypothetical protein [Thioalkalivibrio sp. ALE19]